MSDAPTLAELGWRAWLSMGVVGAVTYGMYNQRGTPDTLMFAGLCILVVAGAVAPQDALAGFSETAVVTIGVLFVCAAAMQETGALRVVSRAVFGQTENPRVALLRMLVPTALMSAFMNNTPIVAMFIPMVRQFAIRIGVAPSKFLMPLAYAAMFGGTCTLVGTSSNLIISSQLERSGLATLGMLEIGQIGVPSSIVGLLYLVFVGYRRLPANRDLLQDAAANATEYLAQVQVGPESPVIGKTVGAAGLRNLDGLFLAELHRADGYIVRPVSPEDRVFTGDHLVFSGEASRIDELVQSIPGLVADDTLHLSGKGLFEVVVSHRSEFVGQTVKKAAFRTKVNAAILAVHRAGERVDGLIGDIVLQPGDTLLLSATPRFYATFKASRNFYMVNALPRELPLRRDKANLTLLTLGGLVLMPALFGIPMLLAAMGALLALFGVRAVSAQNAQRSVNWGVLVLIGSAFGIGKALDSTGAAEALGHALVELTRPLGPRATLAAVYVSGVVFASFINNAAAAALLFPIAATAALGGGHDVRPFAIALAMAASAGFSTPIGCQPNLLVSGPGNYQYGDFVRVGLPLNLLLAVVAIVAIPWIWPFAP
jgi:di/tricarboxylate transporter